MTTREPTDEEFLDALRRYGWLRDDGDGERLHRTRSVRATTEEERCRGFYLRTCALRRGHPGRHVDANPAAPDLSRQEWGALQRQYADGGPAPTDREKPRVCSCSFNPGEVRSVLDVAPHGLCGRCRLPLEPR